MKTIYKKIIAKILERRVDVQQIRESILTEIEHELDVYDRIQKLRQERLNIANKLLQEQADIEQEISRTCKHEYTTPHTDPATSTTEYQCDVCEEWV